MKPFFHVHGVIRVEYRVQTRSLFEDVEAIETETRSVGGSGALCALALSRLGAPVRLSGHALGDDSHGRFIRAQLEGVPGLEADLRFEPDIETPYAILLRGEDRTHTRTLLSSGATRLLWFAPAHTEEGARLLDFSTRNQPGGASQSSARLLDELRWGLRAWLEVTRPASSSEKREVQVERWMQDYDQGFGEWPF